MALTKRELLKQGVPSQTALVQRLTEQAPIKPLKITIPGGKTMLQQIDQTHMHRAVYNWLRGCGAFTEVTISFAKDPEKFRLIKKKAKEFPGGGNPAQMPWESHPKGRQYLAEQIADVINSNRLVQVTADKNGIWAFTDPDDVFGPTRAATQKDLDAQEALAAEVRAEMVENGEDPETLEYEKLELGQELPSEDWQPFIEFIPRNRSQYGR